MSVPSAGRAAVPQEADRQCLAMLSLISIVVSVDVNIVQELCESRGGRPGPSVLTSLLVSVDVKLY